MLRSGRFWLSLGVSGLCLWLAAWSVPLAEVGAILAGGHYLWLLPAVVAQFLAVIARALRWTVLLHGAARPIDAFWAQSVGYLVTNVLPLRLGEAARVVLLARRADRPVAWVGATAVIERLADVATILVALGLVLPWMAVPPLVARAGLSFGVLVIVALAGLVVLARLGRRSEDWLGWVCRPLPARLGTFVLDRWREVAAGLTVLADGRIGLALVVWSVVTWSLSILMYWCVIRAFVADGSLLAATFLVVALSLAVTVPSSPGFIGVFQLVGQQALVLPFGESYSLSSALAITVAAHLTYYLLTSALGAVGLGHFGGTLALGALWGAGGGVSKGNRVTSTVLGD
jgi:hypothetical protein